jgi:hypothetical protein
VGSIILLIGLLVLVFHHVTVSDIVGILSWMILIINIYVNLVYKSLLLFNQEVNYLIFFSYNVSYYKITLDIFF